jgi:hypothetical protein
MTISSDHLALGTLTHKIFAFMHSWSGILPAASVINAFFDNVIVHCAQNHIGENERTNYI